MEQNERNEGDKNVTCYGYVTYELGKLLANAISMTFPDVKSSVLSAC